MHVPSIISADEVLKYRAAALAAAEKLKQFYVSNIFDQFVYVWREDETMRELTLHPRIAEAAGKLAGVPLRLSHDQILIKQPGRSTRTEFHQDQPYWPHAHSVHSLS